MVPGLLVVIVGCGSDSDSAGSTGGAAGSGGSGNVQAEPLSCCRIRMLCTHCEGCPSASTDIYSSRNDAACQAWLENPDYADGCGVYGGTQAIADCAD